MGGSSVAATDQNVLEPLEEVNSLSWAWVCAVCSVRPLQKTSSLCAQQLVLLSVLRTVSSRAFVCVAVAGCCSVAVAGCYCDAVAAVLLRLFLVSGQLLPLFLLLFFVTQAIAE